jgi:hypothetical protein
MVEHSVIVWDLETVPDLVAAARMLDLGGAAEADLREGLGSGFPSLLTTGDQIASSKLARILF